MLVSIDQSVVTDYSLESDTSEPKTIWQLGLFDSFIASKIMNILAHKSKLMKQQAETDLTDLVFEIVRHGLKGVKNLNNPVFKTEIVNVPKIGTRTVVSDEFLEKLDFRWVMELSNKLQELNFPTEPELKN